MLPEVSIVMPAFNSASTLEESVQSVRNQSFGDWELLIVDDASRDSSKSIIGRLTDQEHRISPLCLEKNVGAAMARNVAISRARGRYLAFLDSDDVWEEAKLEKQVAAMKAESLSISFTDYQWIDASGNPMGRVLPSPDKLVYKDILFGNPIGFSTTMLDRDQIKDIELPPFRLNHDYALWLKLLRQGHSIRRIPECLVKYRVHHQSLSRNKLESAFTNFRIFKEQEEFSALKASVHLVVWGIRTLYVRRQRKTPA